jgi:hypothetical protein
MAGASSRTVRVVPKYSTDRLSDIAEQHRRVLLWLAEKAAGNPTVPCGSCGHDIDQHAGTDAPCMFPTGEGAPAVLCKCLRFL